MRWERKPSRQTPWQLWFAWYPIQLDEPKVNKGPWIWLEWIERRRYMGATWYRDIDYDGIERGSMTEDEAIEIKEK